MDDWRNRAACLPYDGDWWVTAAITDQEQKRLNLIAIEICGGCPVTQECEQDAVEQGDTGVIRGGRPMLTKRGKDRRIILPPKPCWCGEEFVPRNTQQRFCTPRCARRAKDERRKAAS